jgi:hypothetical protein
LIRNQGAGEQMMEQMMEQARPYRVIQWATGNIGTRALRHVIEAPQFELAGLYVSSAEKQGRDAGELCGLAPVGTRAVGSLAEVVALDADCVLYMRQGMDPDEICALLASGKNIVSTSGVFHDPQSLDPQLRERVEQACRAGNSSIYSTGSSPGFSTEALAIPLLAQQRRLDSMHIDEFANLGGRASPNLLFEVMGFGAPAGEMDPGRTDHVRHGFSGSLRQIATAIGKPLDDIRVDGEFAYATEDVEIAAGTIRKGTIAAQRITVAGLHGGGPLLAFRANWFVTDRIDRDWPLHETGWRISVRGDVPMDVTIGFPVAADEFDRMSPGITANRAVNAIPALVVAPAGIRTTVDLAQVIPPLSQAAE